MDSLGIYTIPDISRILGLPYSRVQYWIREYWLNDNDFDQNNYIIGDKKDRVTNFFSLIEFYTFSQLKLHGISTQKILKAHNVISEQLKTPYPFASSIILTDGKRVFFSPDNEKSIIHADITLQYNIAEIIRQFCDKIDFKDAMAYRFWPEGRSRSIVIDPDHQFGQPILAETNLLAETLYLLNKGGESIEFISSLYNIPISKVNDAIEFYKKSA